jgi:hypothetical protein
MMNDLVGEKVFLKITTRTQDLGKRLHFVLEKLKRWQKEGVHVLRLVKTGTLTDRKYFSQPNFIHNPDLKRWEVKDKYQYIYEGVLLDKPELFWNPVKECETKQLRKPKET